jgi:CubicO group peptidase (beta-lactamase class C family)
MPSYPADRLARVIADLRPTTTLVHRKAAACSLLERMAHYATPGVSIAVVDGGRVAWERGFGVRTSGQPDPVHADTLFQAGSVSKPVFALGTMCSVEQGRIALDGDIQQYLTSWHIPSNGEWAPRITLGQLLSHTAGTSVHGFPGYPASGPWPTLTQVLNGLPRQPPLEAKQTLSKPHSANSTTRARRFEHTAQPTCAPPCQYKAQRKTRAAAAPSAARPAWSAAQCSTVR